MPPRVSLVPTVAVMLLLIAASAFSPPAPKAMRPIEYQPPRGYIGYRAATPIIIDGKLDDAAWKEIPWSADFVDIEGNAKPKPRYRTRVKMAWDDAALYIAAELEEPHVRAVLTKHDSYIFHEDHDFEVFLDPDGDGHLYAELEMNARNTTWDLLLTKPYKNGGKAIDAWEIDGLKSAVQVNGTLNDARDTDRGWTIEIAWPWQGLRQISSRPVPPKAGDQWRINFSRVELDFDVVDGQYRRIKRPEHNWVWSPQGVVDMHRPETWGYLQFSNGKPGTDSLKPDPTGPARAVLHRVAYAQAQFRQKHGKYGASLDALGLGGITHESLIGPLRLEVTSNGFEANVQVKDGGRVRIEKDAQIIVEAK